MGLKGYKHTKEAKRKISEASKGNKSGFKKGNIPWNKGLKGLHHSPSTEWKKGNTPWNKGKKNIFSKEARRKMSLSHFNHLRKYGYTNNFGPNIGTHEKSILDHFEKLFNYPIERQYQVDGFFIDGYCKPLKLAIEIDENYHYQNQKQYNYDRFRENIIKDIVGCSFLRIPINEVK